MLAESTTHGVHAIVCAASSRSASHADLRVGQALQKIVLQFLEGDGVFTQLAYKAAGLLLQVRPLMPHHLSQQLLLQTHLCHTEVHQSGLCSNLRLVVGVGQLGLQVQPAQHNHLCETMMVNTAVCVDQGRRFVTG